MTPFLWLILKIFLVVFIFTLAVSFIILFWIPYLKRKILTKKVVNIKIIEKVGEVEIINKYRKYTSDDDESMMPNLISSLKDMELDRYMDNKPITTTSLITKAKTK